VPQILVILLWIYVNNLDFIIWFSKIIVYFHMNINNITMFARNAIFSLREWAGKTNRKPLVVRGARQVGKTSLINEFGKEFDLYLPLNLEKKQDREFFIGGAPVKQIFESVIVSRNLRKPKGRVLLFIDEIQYVPYAIQSLRYFYEELPDIFVIAAGSLLETLLTRQISFPVGRVEYMALRPCTFTEFLGAIGEETLLDKLQTTSVNELLHPRMMELFKLFTLIGGMPEVIENYRNNKDIIALADLFESLVAGYQDDVEKYSPKESLTPVIRFLIKNGWKYASERITFEKFAKSRYTSREISDSFRILEKALLLEMVYPTTENKLPITKNLRKKPKLIWMDTGIVNYASGIHIDVFNSASVSDTWRGRIAEHIVGQEIAGASNRFLEERCFWVREARNSQAELDYLYSSNTFGIIPIEVKSSSASKLKSLHLFMGESSTSIAIRFWSNPESKDSIILPNGKRFDLYNLPFYYAGLIEPFLKTRAG
jgi:predicted AAA+ superfamily ATPase